MDENITELEPVMQMSQSTFSNMSSTTLSQESNIWTSSSSMYSLPDLPFTSTMTSSADMSEKGE